MSNDQKTTITAGAALVGVVLIVALVLRWPVWAWLPIVFLAIAGVALVQRWLRSKGEQRRMAEEMAERWQAAPPPEPERPQQEVLDEVALPSAVPDYQFLLSGNVYWLPNWDGSGPAQQNPGSVAKYAIIQRAAEVLAIARPSEHSTLGERLNAVLGEVHPARSGHIVAWGGGLKVALPESDKNRLYRLAEVRKEVEVWEHERNHERNVREYLGDDVLSDPGSAVVWWLARHQPDSDSGLQTVVSNIEKLRHLTSAAHATEIPDLAGFRDMYPQWPDRWRTAGFPTLGEADLGGPLVVNGVAGEDAERIRARKLVALLGEAVDGMDEDLFITQQAKLLDSYRYHTEAAALRERFGLEQQAPEPESGDPADAHMGRTGVSPPS